MPKSLTLGETAQVEEISGQSIADLDNPTAPKSRLLGALVMVIKKRTNPDFTLEDAWSMDTTEAADLIADAFGVNDDPK